MNRFTLVFTLGRGVRQQESSRYRTATYQFSDGHVSEPSSFFGLCLLEWLRKSKGQEPEQVVVLGTRSSIWDALLEFHEDAVDEAALHLSGELITKVNAGMVADEDLKPLAKWLQAWLGPPFLLRVIPEALNHEEQMRTLKILSDCVPEKTELHMCVTHGLRHMPMLQLLSVFHLAETKRVRLGGLYYGALEMGKNGQQCPVVELTGAVDIQRWSMALHTVTATGRMSALADAAEQEAPDLSGHLREMDFRLGANQVGRAALSGRQAADIVNRDGLPGAGDLFSKAAIGLLTWASQGRLWEKQRLLAIQALQNGDSMRAAILCLEGFISKSLPTNVTDTDYARRDQGYKELLHNLRREDLKEMKTLEYLRNAIAHGSSSDNQEVRDLLSDPAVLRKFVDKMLNRLFQ